MFIFYLNFIKKTTSHYEPLLFFWYQLQKITICRNILKYLDFNIFAMIFSMSSPFFRCFFPHVLTMSSAPQHLGTAASARASPGRCHWRNAPGPASGARADAKRNRRWSVILWWFYGDFMVILWWFYGDFMVILWWFYGHFMVILWWFYGDFMVFIWWFYGHFMVILWWFYCDFIVILLSF